MNTLDKINQELAVLQQELSQLRHYTNEIGEAKHAAKSVIDMSLSFLRDFQSNVTLISEQTDSAAKEFRLEVEKAGKELDVAAVRFGKVITEAKYSLDEIGNQLGHTATSVKELAVKIEEIDILGHFTKVHETFAELHKRSEEQYQQLELGIASFSERQNRNYKNLRIAQQINLAISVVILTLILVFALR